MPSRRSVLEKVGGVAVLGTLGGVANYLGIGFVRTKAGGGFGGTIAFESPDSETFVPPTEFSTYVAEMQEQYGDAAVPWSNPDSFDGEFVGAYTRQNNIVPSEKYAVQDAAVLAHRLDDARYRLRLWSAGRLLDTKYEVDPWGYYREDPAFTWLEHEIEAETDDQLSTDRSVSANGGDLDVASGSVSVPNGSYDMGLADETRYRSRWEGFHAGEVPLVGACEVSFPDGAEQRLDWSLSNGVGVRTPF